jgi:predicted nuclease of predicted toxin-antitoxin system
MNLLFDQNISSRILKLLPARTAGSSHVKFEGLTNAHDRQVWEYAKKNNFTIVTQDSDFNDLTTLLGFPPKIIWIRTGNLKTAAIHQIIAQHLEEIGDFINDSTYGCFEITRISP